MKPEEIESYKFQAESLRNFGLAFCSPLSIALLKIIFHEITFEDMHIYETIILVVLFSIGFTFISRSVDIMVMLRKKEL